MIGIDPNGNLAFRQGSGIVDGFCELNALCGSKVVGDYTGLTQP